MKAAAAKKAATAKTAPAKAGAKPTKGKLPPALAAYEAKKKGGK
jgi:hypothetical protein